MKQDTSKPTIERARLKILKKIGLDENQFIISSQKSGQTDVNVDTQTIIQISKKKYIK